MLKITKYYQALFIFFVCVFCIAPVAFAQSGLDRIHQKLIKKYENVEHINSDDFSEMNAEDLVIFDVRKQKEFAVSHIEGSIRIDPDTEADEFAAQYADQLICWSALFGIGI